MADATGLSMGFTCPTCNVPLQPQKLDNVLLWSCPSCNGLVISIPTVRKGMEPGEFRRIWQQLYSDDVETGRPCPGCKNPLSVLKADGQDGQILIDICRSCQVLWFDEEEFSGLPRAEPEVEPDDTRGDSGKKRPASRVLTPEELTYRAFKQDQYQRRSFLYKLLDGSVSKEFGLDSFFGKFFNK